MSSVLRLPTTPAGDTYQGSWFSGLKLLEMGKTERQHNMAVDDLKTEYHLTKRGWTPGTSYSFGKAKEEIAPPPDRVLTMVEQIYQSSRFSREETSWAETWRSPEVSDEELETLRKKFPLP